jgi:hypothetical protein
MLYLEVTFNNKTILPIWICSVFTANKFPEPPLIKKSTIEKMGVSGLRIGSQRQL